MNSYFNKIILSFLIAGICILKAQEKFVDITIQTNVDSAGLFFDDNFVTVGRNFLIQSKLGKHHIQLIENLKEWDSQIISDTILIEDSQGINLNYNFKSEIELNTVPQDVRVFEKDSLIGFTPILLETGFKDLKLEKPNYTSLYVASQEIETSKVPELEFIGEPPKKQFYGSALFDILVGTAVALGATTAYYKLEADNNFDEYIITGDPELIDQVDHYDAVSAATLVAMEITVGLIIYFFLSN